MRPCWSEITALFGGRFDPPHLGHLEAIRGLFKNPGVRETWVLPSPTPPHKSAIATFEHRSEMARLGLCHTPEVRLDLREGRRPAGQPSYTFDTLQEIRRETTKIAFVIGTDQLADFMKWHRFSDVLKLCHWIVLDRKSTPVSLYGLQAAGLIQEIGSGLWEVRGGSTFLQLTATNAPALSSTSIRETLAKTGAPPPDALHPQVEAYLMQHRLYGTRGDLT